MSQPSTSGKFLRLSPPVVGLAELAPWPAAPSGRSPKHRGGAEFAEQFERGNPKFHNGNPMARGPGQLGTARRVRHEESWSWELGAFLGEGPFSGRQDRSFSGPSQEVSTLFFVDPQNLCLAHTPGRMEVFEPALGLQEKHGAASACALRLLVNASFPPMRGRAAGRRPAAGLAGLRRA